MNKKVVSICIAIFVCIIILISGFLLIRQFSQNKPSSNQLDFSKLEEMKDSELVDLFYNRGLILKALQQFFYRSQAAEGHVTWYNGICNNLIRAEIRIGIYTTFIIVLLLVLLVKNYKKIYIDIKKSLPYLIVSLMPFAWYLLVNNHSTYHSFFTYRALMVFYIGFGVFLVNLFNTEKNTPKETIKKGEEE